jgi:hypothetical protein
MLLKCLASGELKQSWFSMNYKKKIAENLACEEDPNIVEIA